MRFAVLHIPAGEWTRPTVFMLLRAFHYLSDYCGVTEFRLNVTSVPEDVRKSWDASFTRRKKILSVQYGVCTDGLDMFTFPDYPMYLDGKERIDLNIPEIPGLTDFHVHSPMAYCGENMNVPGTMEMAHVSRLAMVNIAEHSGQLYCLEPDYWGNRFRWKTRNPEEDRSWKYKNVAKNLAGPGRIFGLELDVDEDAVVCEVQSEYLTGYRVGAIHFLGHELPYEELKADFMRRFDALLASKIDILAHPFRVFAKRGVPVPKELFNEVAEKLVRANVAAELNFHAGNRPQAEFVELVLKKGGKISWGSDSHNLYEVGYFKPHYEFCKELGIAGKLDDILLSAKK
jgi:histidinol phosphatase-like PHP family hydrolase